MVGMCFKAIIVIIIIITIITIIIVMMLRWSGQDRTIGILLPVQAWLLSSTATLAEDFEQQDDDYK